ncbi:MAG: hypothetical protein IMY67_01795 [Bacteroidetes bacterium]|nr:hypothetical protein [Bacteroidota bacterium]
MNIEEQKQAEQFYIESDINGIHTQRTNMVEVNYLDLAKLMHSYAEKKVKEIDCKPHVKISFDELKHKILKFNAKSEYQQAAIVILRLIYEEHES